MFTAFAKKESEMISCLAILTIFIISPVNAQVGEMTDDFVVIKPKEYPRALRNPHKGFTNRGFGERNEWATLAHCYIQWNEIENHKSDTVEKIREWCNAKWKGVKERNIKVIPRVYLHWSGNRKYWPEDMEPDDYSSATFKRRVVRLIKRLGECWDEDPRVAHIEMGIIGKWGEHHSPSPSDVIQKLLGDAFSDAFKRKKVLVRHPWEFADYSFGIYWDSWAHANQMNSHGKAIERLGDRWKQQIIGGEVAYNWGQYHIQPGDNPTDTITDPLHRQHFINTIRRLHCTQLRWVAAYDHSNPAARAGAEEVQKAFGYRFLITQVRYPKRIEPGKSFEVSFEIKNAGSAPFYYHWPIEICLLNQDSKEPVWRDTFEDVDICEWLPGTRWSELKQLYEQEPDIYKALGSFQIDSNFKTGKYVLALSILDPAGNVPSARFAIQNYFTGGRHPIGFVAVGVELDSPTLYPTMFDDPAEDQTLRYFLGEPKKALQRAR